MVLITAFVPVLITDTLLKSRDSLAWIAVVAVVVIAAVAMLLWPKPTIATRLKLTVTALLVADSLNAVLFFLYCWLLEAGFGSTLGKVIVGVRVIQTPGAGHRPLSHRNLFRIVDGFGFYLVGVVVAGCSRIQRHLGDICAGTVVLESRFGYGVKIAAVVLWTAVLAGAVWFVPRTCKTDAARHSRYLNQVIVEVGRSGKSPYFRVAGIHVQANWDRNRFVS